MLAREISHEEIIKEFPLPEEENIKVFPIYAADVIAHKAGYLR